MGKTKLYSHYANIQKKEVADTNGSRRAKGGKNQTLKVVYIDSRDKVYGKKELKE